MADDAVTLTPPPVGGAFGRFFCSAPHPDIPDVWCRRQPQHPGEQHRAFVFSVKEPEEW